MLAFLYALLGGYIIISLIMQCVKEKKINYFTFFSIYFFVYYIVPALVHNLCPSFVSRYSYAISYGDGTFFAFFLILLAYFSLKIGYYFLLTKKKNNISDSNIIAQNRTIKNESELFNKAIIILWIVGFIALLVHSYSYGGIANALINSALIRDGQIDSNASTSIAFISRFIICFMYSSYFVFIKYLKNETTLPRLVFSIFWAVIYLVVHAGRGAILTYILTCTYIYILIKGKRIKIKNWSILFIIVLFGVNYIRPLLVSLASITDGFGAFWDAFINRISSNNEMGDMTSNLFYKLCYNLEHKYVSLEIAIKSIKNGLYSFNMFRDVWVAIISILPSAMIPFTKPKSIAYYNTVLIKGYNYTTGAVPPGGVAFGYYALGIPGVILFSSIIGIIGRKIEKYLDAFNSNYFIGIKVINMFVWIDFFINGELKECVIRYFVFIIILIITYFSSRKVGINNEKDNGKYN